MPTQEELMAALAASRAAREANVNRFTGRQPLIAPQMVQVAEPVTGTIQGEVDWGFNTFAASTTEAPRMAPHWGDGIMADIIIPATLPTVPPPLEPEETKSVEFEGLELEVPVWARYITQDVNGSIKAWEREPLDWLGNQWANVHTNGRIKLIMKPEPYPHVRVRIE